MACAAQVAAIRAQPTPAMRARSQLADSEGAAPVAFAAGTCELHFSEVFVPMQQVHTGDFFFPKEAQDEHEEDLHEAEGPHDQGIFPETADQHYEILFPETDGLYNDFFFQQCWYQFLFAKEDLHDTEGPHDQSIVPETADQHEILFPETAGLYNEFFFQQYWYQFLLAEAEGQHYPYIFTDSGGPCYNQFLPAEADCQHGQREQFA